MFWAVEAVTQQGEDAWVTGVMLGLLIQTLPYAPIGAKENGGKSQYSAIIQYSCCRPQDVLDGFPVEP
jgi:hypothetical protein